MKLVWRPAAQLDRDRIMDYIEQNSPRSAYALDLEFSEKAKLTITNPTMYRAGRIRGTREIVVHKNYIIVYKVDDKPKVITILRVLHTAQQLPKKTEIL